MLEIDKDLKQTLDYRTLLLRDEKNSNRLWNKERF